MIARLAALACLVACMPPTRGGSFGALRWEVAPTNVGLRQLTMALDPAGDVIVAGLDGTGAVMKLSGRDGAPMWTTKLSGNVLSMPHVAVDHDGNVLLTGLYQGNADFGGTIMNGGGGTAFVAKYSPDGALLWVRDLGPNAQACGLAIGVASTGAAYVIGSCEGTVVLPGETVACPGSFVARFDGDGTARWIRMPTVGTQFGVYSSVTPDDALLIVDADTSPTTIQRFDLAGSSEWTATLSRDAMTGGIAATHDAGVVATVVGERMLVAVDKDGYGEWSTDSAYGGPIAVTPDGRIFTVAGGELVADDAHGNELDVAAWPYLGDGVDRSLYALAASSDSLAFLGTGQATGSFVGVVDLRWSR